jgi:hypothetical protein
LNGQLEELESLDNDVQWLFRNALKINGHVYVDKIAEMMGKKNDLCTV